MTHKRFSSPLNLKQYTYANPTLSAGDVSATPPKDTQMILRMLVEAPYSRGRKLPPELKWLQGVIEQAQTFQSQVIGIRHPFTYITVRHGVMQTTKDDQWHVDGFSLRYNHLPESNFVFTYGSKATEVVEQAIVVPNDFNPLRHNFHDFIGKRVNEKAAFQMQPGMLYHMDPYVIHRRPPGTHEIHRTFVRIGFTPIEIPDRNNTPNPLIPTPHYVTDGVLDFRDTLVSYDT